MILVLGTGTGSMAQTSRIIKPLIEFFFPGAAPDTFLLVHAAIRKTAHFVEYAILAFLASRAFVLSGSAAMRSRWAAGALALVIATAAIDELNQSFLATRTGSPWDVMLDLCGGLSAVLVVYAFRRRRSLAAHT